MSETPVPPRIPAQVWNEINTETMKGVLTLHAQTNAHIWTAINEVVLRLVRAGVIVDPSDADHAVAIEREAIAAYLESDRWNNRGPGWEEWEVSQAAAQAIRAGEHHREDK